jgi:hypothetical protein
LTAAIIGGGSDGIHKMVSVITDFLDVTRKKVQAAAPPEQQKSQSQQGQGQQGQALQGQGP